MKVLRGLSQKPEFSSGTVAAIGNFDGVHLGHQALLKQLRQKAEVLGLPVLLVIFEPQPGEYFHGDHAPVRLFSLREKLHHLKAFGVDYVLCLQFNESLSVMPPVDFAVFIFERLHIQYLLVGQDFRFGHKRLGDMSLLKAMAARQGAHVQILSNVVMADTRVSSTRIRQALQQTQLQQAKTLLGRHYSLCGRVVRGAGRGRQWGIPTANLHMSHRRRLPFTGVFCVQIRRHNALLYGVANLGCRPTVDGEQFILEVHVFDFSESLYGERLEVIFLKKLRNEIKFDSFQDLRSQIHQDIAEATLYFKQNIFVE